jgi:hypothetical protein
VAFLRRKPKDLPQLAEDEVYARSYGERSDEVSNVQPVPAHEEEPQPDRRLTDRGLRDAFRSRLEKREPG